MAETPEKDLSIQNDFFNQARKSRTRVAILLSSGKRLVGRIKAFDRFTVILDAGGGSEEMVFKHAIATISMSPRPQGGDPRGGGDPRARIEAPAREPVAVPAGASVAESATAPSTVPVPGGPVKS